MANDSVRIGVIGAGAIGPSHAWSINQAEGCTLAAICDIQPELAARLAEEHGVPSFGSIQEMVEADAVDAVTLATPSGFHLEAALEAIKSGKHILIEKPMEITPDRIDPIIAAADKAGVKLAGVFQSRYRPIAQRMKSLMDSGLVGDVYAGSCYIKRYRTQEYYDSGGWRGTWKVDGGGCLMNQGIHAVDLFMWFLGDVDEVVAISETVGRNIEVETLALGLLKFASGAKGVIEATTLAYPEFSPYLEIYGSRGTMAFEADKVLRMDLMEPTEAEAAERDALLALSEETEAAKRERMKNVAPGTPIASIDMGHTPVINDFVDAIREDRVPLVDGVEARRPVELISAIYESGRQGSRPVRLG